MLWFDVGVKRYTTTFKRYINSLRCGLMQESKDIQHCIISILRKKSCGLMQESKDIQPNYKAMAARNVVV